MAESNTPSFPTPESVLIVGGSLTSLLYAIALASLPLPSRPQSIRIFERLPRSRLHAQAGAGLSVPPDLEKFFTAHAHLDREAGKPYFLENRKANVVDADGKVFTTLEPGVRATSWDSLYGKLRRMVEGLRGEGVEYFYGREVVGLRDLGEGGGVEVRFLDGRNEGEDDGDGGEEGSGSTEVTTTADLVIAADGSGSMIRRLLMPEIERQYVGYVAWRGTVPEKLMTEEMKEVFLGDEDRHCQIEKSFFISLVKDLFILKLRSLSVLLCHLAFTNPNSHDVVKYTMPGPNTTIEYPNRLRNWVWYLPYLPDSASFKHIMTDIHNVTHRYTLPAGLIRPEIWTAQKHMAKRRLDTNSANLIGLTEQPFIQAITEVVCDRCLFLDGKLLLVGDAFSTFRPLSGQGTNQGAKGATALKEVFSGKATLGSWETIMKKYAEKTQAFGVERETQAQLHQA